MGRASCLVILHLDFVVLSLIYFSPRCFDLKDFNLKKRFEPLRKGSSCLPDQMSQMYVVYASKSDCVSDSCLFDGWLKLLTCFDRSSSP